TTAHSAGCAISADGLKVAFESDDDQLVPGDTNSATDIFVHDIPSGLTTMVSLGSTGYQGNSGAISPALSSDGRFVSFRSGANNLVTGDTNSVDDIFVHDRMTHTTTRVSVDSAGQQASADSFYPVLSGDGRWVAFPSVAADLVLG